MTKSKMPAGRPSPLRSLLTLAAGAAALPAAANAGIVYSNIYETVATSGSEYTIDLPGTAELKIKATYSGSSQRILAGAGTAGYVRVGRQSNTRSATVPGTNVAFRTDAGANWGAAARTDTATFGNIIRNISAGISGPAAFTTKYLLFKFTNTVANQLQYGWLKMENAAGPANQSVTLTGWAYDNTGATIHAGDGTTLVVMNDFYLREEDGVPVVRWDTSTEEKSVGFDLFRWADGAWMKVNSELIQARGQDGMGAAYAVSDASANATDTFRYKVVEYETDGGTQEYGFTDVSACNPRLEKMSATADGIVLRWLSREQDTYEVQKSINIHNGFEPIATDLPATPPVNVYTDQVHSANGAYYRVRVK